MALPGRDRGRGAASGDAAGVGEAAAMVAFADRLDFVLVVGN